MLEWVESDCGEYTCNGHAAERSINLRVYDTIDTAYSC